MSLRPVASHTSPPRVLCLAGWWPDEGGLAGIFITEHVRAIATRCAVEVLYMEVVKGPWQWPSTRILRSVEDGIPVHRVRITTPVRRFGVLERLVRRAYARVLEPLHGKAPFDLAHIHVRTEITQEVVTWAVRQEIPVLITEHNSYYHLGIRELPPRAQEHERRAITRWFAQPGIAAVMPVSINLGSVLHHDFGVPQELMTTVPNVAHEAFHPAYKPAPPPFRLVLAAIWRPPKDHGVFIDALHLLPAALRASCQVEWVGYGPAMNEIKERCRKELADMDIRFSGQLDKFALAALMQKAHLFVLPTKADNLPCVVLESLCCGTPVVSMAVNGVPELVNETNGILVPPSNARMLADALVRCMHDPDRFDHAAIADRAERLYSRDAVAQAILAVYRKALPQWSGA